MESREELESMNVRELDQFLRRYDLSRANVPSSREGKVANKADVLAFVLNMRSEYEQRFKIKTSKSPGSTRDRTLAPTHAAAEPAAAEKQELAAAPGSSSAHNPFQVDSSPGSSGKKHRSRRRSVDPEAAQENAKTPSAIASVPHQDQGQPIPQSMIRKKLEYGSSNTPKSEAPKPTHERRKSVGWVSDDLLLPTPKKAVPAGLQEVHPHDAGSHAQNAPHSGAADLSLDESSGWEDSTDADTDDADSAVGREFGDMTVIALRKELSRQNIPFSHRAKKAELVGLLRGHSMQKQTEQEPYESPETEHAARQLVGRHATLTGAAVRPVDPPRRRKWPISPMLFKAMFSVGVGLGMLFLIYFVMQKPYFCSSVRGSLPDPETCEPCPENAVCVGGSMRCKEGFQQASGGMRCIEAKQTSLAVEWARSMMERQLCKRRGMTECKLAPSDSATMSASELYAFWSPAADADIAQQPFASGLPRIPSRYQRFSDAQRSLVLDRAFALLANQANIQTVGNTEQRQLMSLDACKPIECKVYEFLMANLWICVGSVLIGAVTLYMYIKWHKRQQHELEIENSYQEALGILHQQALDARNQLVDRPFVLDTHLRDELFSTERVMQKRTKKWADVQLRMRYDSRLLRTGPREVDGVPCIVWEWRAALTPSKRGTPRASDMDD
ncbi:hypothetical protein FVE85_7427 [Porphyridium purpureum]|uniref:Man1/Src1-like C-terminal domain-containing protein n=1 Tax=Porphyridium purpureum TaxID=35688 RepID=A0A5J4Z9Z0_PORPP|nr:hypothetical protein FVE85_7427 [Porphyridium purpureum]|eukprot:POR1391..scf295_1